MPNDSLFKPLARIESATVEIVVDGVSHHIAQGLTVAAALLQLGVVACRTTPVSGADRAPFCMMGVCFDCLVEINGIPNRQGCMVPVQDGMQVRRMDGARSVA